tara:strand:- start:3953 stop:4897 length:945 start_codon:yes stop_codon:yes gene_type:complete
MTATITVTGADHNYNSSQATFRTAVKAGLAGIGVTTGQIEYDSGSHVICKISNGSGTYADNFIRFEQNGHTTYAHSMQMGTGYSSGTEVTGAGIEQPGFYSINAKKHRYIKANDGTFGVVQILNSSTDVCEGSYGFIKPTNTTQTAADIPLVMGLGSIKGSAVQTGANGAGFDAANFSYNLSGFIRYWDSSSNSYVSINSPGNLRLLFSGTKKGSNSYGALGSTVFAFGGQSSTSTNYFGQSVHSVSYGLHNNIDGNLPIVPNVPIMSGGVPIGYNSNLVFCPPNLNPGDNIVITAGSEEYTVISSDGIAIRKV